MEPPIPPPRNVKKNSPQNLIETIEDENDQNKDTSSSLTSPHVERGGIIQVSAEVHSANSTGRTLEQQEEKRVDKKRRKVRRRGTYTKKEKSKDVPKTDKLEVSYNDNGTERKNEVGFESQSVRRGSLTETISDSDSGKIKLVPLRAISGRRRAPAGSATETLSEESEKNEFSPKMPRPLPPVPPRRKSTPLAITSATEQQPDKSPAKSLNNETIINESHQPVPAPRNISKSTEQIVSPYCTSSSLEYKDPDPLPSRMRKPKKKRKLRDSKEIDPSPKSKVDSSTESPKNQASAITTSTKGGEDKKEKTAYITVHRCEPLHLKHFNRRQFVRVHVMDLTSGKYKRSALGKMNIEPVSTSPFDYGEHRLAMPTWEEDLIFSEPLSHIVSADTLLILEIVDCEKDDIIAWAFLKPVAANGALNTGKTLRLQLYKPGKPSKDTSIPKGFQWWSLSKYSNYQSTLFITLNGIPSEMIIKPSLNEAGSLKENNDLSKDEVDNEHSVPSPKKEDSDIEEVVWSRLPSLTCKIPNSYEATIDTGNTGSMAVAYSHSGIFLACQVEDSICVFDFKGKIIVTLTGHQGLIYCLKWSEDDRYLLSSSADTTACVWDFKNRRVSPVQVLSHPSYVYSCCWLDDSNGLIVTACFDKYIRLWKLGTRTPLQHVLKHVAAVNAVAVIDHETLVSGDNTGIIIMWKLNSNEQLEFLKEVIIREIRGKIINKLVVHSGRKRMLVHTRDSVLRMLDITTGTVVQWFRGGLNTRLRCDSCFCGCGSRIFATCEDGSTCCWDAHTGQMVALYTRIQMSNGAASIDYHPYDHYMAVGTHSPLGNASLSIVKYDRESNGKDIGLIYIDAPQMDLSASSQSLNSSLSGSNSSNPQIRGTHSSAVVPASSEERKSKRKDVGIFKALLGRKKTKKGETNNAYQSTEIETNTTITSRKNKKIPTSSFTQCTQETRDDRLSDIIKKMDKILTTLSTNKVN